MRAIRAKIARAMHDDLPVLIEGESGTGKEVVARFLHQHSVRSGGAFLKLNCAAGSARLLEEEMFGYEKSPGSRAVGLASAGTLFLDEIHDMDLALQQKLFEVLRSGHYRHIDSREELAVNARLVCATSADLTVGLQNRTFLEELLGCFAHHRLKLLPLRERREDIPRLCEYLLEKFAHDFGCPVPHLSSDMLEAFQQWRWPGNVRELENWIARIVIFGAEEVIGLEFSRQLAAAEQPAPRYPRSAHTSFSRARSLRRHR
jgi:DNA-binding NtrC family response regulator